VSQPFPTWDRADGLRRACRGEDRTLRTGPEIGGFALIREARACGGMADRLNHMKILKKTFAIGKAFDYISAPRQTE